MIVKNSNNMWITENPLFKNKDQRYYYDFGTGIKIERDEVKKERDAFLDGFNSVGPTGSHEKESGLLQNAEHKITKLPFTPSQKTKIETLPGNINKPLTIVQYAKGETKDPWGSTFGGDLKSNEDKELFLEGFIGETKQPQIKVQSTINKKQADPFLEGFNSDSTEANKWTPDLLEEKTTGISNPRLSTETGRALNELQSAFRGLQFESKSNPTMQRFDSSPTITTAVNRDPNEEPVVTQFSNDNNASDFTKGLGNALKRSFLDAFAPVYLKPSAHTALWFAGAETYLKQKGYDTSAWLLKHSLQPKPEDVYRDDNSRIAQLIKKDPAFLKELDIAIANSDGKTLDTTISVSFEQDDLYYSIHKNDIKLTGYKDENGKWKISAKMDDEYNFSELMTGKGENGIGVGTLANDVAHFSEMIGAITPYNIYVDFNIER